MTDSLDANNEPSALPQRPSQEDTIADVALLDVCVTITEKAVL